MSDIEKEVDVKFHQQVRNFFGDYYFLKIIKIMLKNKKVYYTNCVIPQVERSLNCLNSHEIQHGVIHDSNLDYSHVPYIKNKIFVYNEHYRRLLEQINFSGQAVVIEKTPYRRNCSCDCIFFTTVDAKYALFIEKLMVAPEFQPFKKHFRIKKHPRDSYRYKTVKHDQFLDKASPLDAKLAILPDSSLIIDMVKERRSFIYLDLHGESKLDIQKRLLKKYDAKPNLYFIANNETSLCQYVKEMM